ncbi:MAG TPA: Fur family transcriptional regulator [Acidimicrobiales bacterium]|nr:Fur family transcriptional regulator [Acidimicrobiales bacterium]
MATGGGRSEREEQVLARLRARGGRVTGARRAVLAGLLDGPGHVSAEELAEVVRRSQPEVHLSTVYRALEAFEALGVVTHVHLGHGRAIYHLTDQLQHHAACERCGAVIHLPDGLFADVAERLEGDFGFHLDTHHFALVGTCERCAHEAGGPASVSAPPR